MCGIIGLYSGKDKKTLNNQLEIALEILKERGKDGKKIVGNLGHTLHSIVGAVPQPLKKKGIFAANCEIYNWKELKEKNKLKAKNDSELLFHLLEIAKLSDIKKVLNNLDGVYAFAYEREEKVILARDIIGIKPLWFSHSDGFAFASEKKALEKLGYLDILELSPRDILEYDIRKDKISFKRREFFSISPINKDKKETLLTNTKKLLIESIKKRIPETKFGVLFSGGIDSTLIAFILKNLKKDFTCYTAVLDDPGLREPEDLIYAKKIAKNLNLDLKIIKIKTNDVPKHLKKLVPLIEDSNVVKVGVGLTFYAACNAAKKDGCKVIFSGLGSEEIFAGYQRHKNSQDINKECVSGLLKMHERDTYRDDVITMYHNIELRVPFLDKALVNYALKIPEKYKIKGEHSKVILREVADSLGLEKEFAWRKKRAAQYGSNFDKALAKLTKKSGNKYKSDYLRQFYPKHNLKLGAMISSGKDGIFAAYVMMRQNYSVDCFITVKSKNLDSFMFHTPNVSMVEMQSKACNIPLIEGTTKGIKEEELKDLKKIIEKAKIKYALDGIITGALYSTYQRDRIEKVCDSLGLKIFSPLWHINQETEMREILKEGFSFILSSVAAEGLGKRLLGRPITSEDIDYLSKINEKIGINIAGEGGEFESLVIDGPMFQKKIVIKKAKIVMENEITGKYIIEEAILEDK